MLASIGAVMPRPFSALYEQNLAVVRGKLEETSFEAAFGEGQLMTVDEAIDYALSK
jgi:hypothetical protein